MKKLVRYALALMAALGFWSANAQSEGYGFGGTLMQQATLSPGQMAQISQSLPVGTARTIAMGGAFASLGADLGSMAINPAGLGMFRHNEVSLTPMITVSHAENSQPDYAGNSKTRFTPSNFGFLVNAYEGTGHVVSVNFGIGYNRIADLNYHTSYQFDSPFDGSNASPSLLNAMAGQLTVNDLYPDESGFLGYYGNSYPDLWGSMLAYNSYLLNPYTDSMGDYWEADHVGYNALVGHFYESESRGSVGEWDISVGMNIDNILYLGVTLGIQQVSQRVESYYGEDYLYQDRSGQSVPATNAAGQELIEQADFIHYRQEVYTGGVGINAKIGAIVRPTAGLRIGVALHTPTAYTLDHNYFASMSSVSYNNDEQRYYSERLDTDGDWEDMGRDAWRFRSPLRLMAGVSYTLSSRAVFSVDYERTWYGGMRSTQQPWWIPNPADYTRSAFQSLYAATNTLRAGVEFKPIQRLALRLGAGYTDSMVKSEVAAWNYPTADKVVWYSAGVGFAITPSTTLDVAYQYHNTSYHAYRLFFGSYTGAGLTELFDAAEPVSTDLTRHHIALTMSFKF